MGDARKRQFDAIVVWRFISYQENMDTSSPLGQALFTIVSAVAQLERDLTRERVFAGLRNARANGKKLGRPKSAVDGERILELRAEGQSLRQIAANLEVAYGTVRARLLNGRAKNPTRNVPANTSI
jgi:DNA invertase Pin-like site-specific DNA recombinase